MTQNERYDNTIMSESFVMYGMFFGLKKSIKVSFKRNKTCVFHNTCIFYSISHEKNIVKHFHKHTYIKKIN